MTLTAWTLAAALVAVPVAGLAQDYDPWSDTGEWPSYVEPSQERERSDWRDYAPQDAPWGIEEENRRRFNEINQCMHTINEAAQERCFRALGR